MLELADISRRYGDVVALRDVSFRAPRGKTVGLLGPNGAGKTTAMQIAMGVRRADGGEVRWDDHLATERDRLRFGYMPEERGLYPRMRVRDQLAYLARLHGLDRDEAGQRADRWLDRMDLAQRAGSRVEQLSSGNQQRVQLGTALVHSPDLVILDEPFAGLDPIALETLVELVHEQSERGSAVVLSTHQLDLAEDICDEVVVVVDGRVVLEGPLEQLRGAGPRRLRVEGPKDPGWAEDLKDVSVVRAGEGSVVLELAERADPQDVLRAAMEEGPVTFFGFETPRLSELFRRAVGR
jgi:ABC-2 type transport system ATP-binding protein